MDLVHGSGICLNASSQDPSIAGGLEDPINYNCMEVNVNCFVGSTKPDK